MNRRRLVYEASQEAAAARDAVGYDQFSPISAFELASALGLSVRFPPVNMDGMYEQGPPPKILVSPYRPLVRRHFTSAHEIGHHRFGHGSTFDELTQAGQDRHSSDSPDEVLAEAFAAFVLMPPIGIRGAFSRRNATPADACPLDVFTIASDFGVGYATLIAHLTYTMREMDVGRRTQLLRTKLPDLRRMALGFAEPSPLIIIDDVGKCAAVEIEVGACILAPHGSASSGSLEAERELPSGILFRARARGLAGLTTPTRDIEVRVMPEAYVGLAQFRFREDPDD